MAHRLSFICIALAISRAAGSATSPGAQPSGSQDEVLVTASRLGAAAATTPYSAQVISATEMAGRTDIADALGDLAEIHIQTPGGRSGTASLFLRGADPNFTTVLFDGVPLNNPTDSRGGAVNVAALDAATLERIEVVAGPASSLFGSGALAGVIDLVVPAGTATHQIQTSVGGGTLGDWSTSARWRGPVAAGLGASLTVVADDAGHEPPRSAFSMRSITAKLAPLQNEAAGRAILHVDSTDAKTWPDSSGGPRLATRAGLESRQSHQQLLGLAAPVLRTGALRLDLSATLLDRRDDTISPGIAPSSFDAAGVPGGTDLSRYRRVSGQAIGRMTQTEASLIAGVEAQREQGSSRGRLDFGRFQLANDFELRRATLSGFVETALDRKHWHANAGLRLDDVEGLRSRMTARAGARVDIPGTRLSLRAATGSGFKAPSFYALGNPFIGNAKLRPETSVGEEVALTWSGRLLKSSQPMQPGQPEDTISITWFNNRYSDLIDFLPGPPPRLENRSLVVAAGAALAASMNLSPRLSGTLQAQFAATRDDASGTQLLNRPRWRVNAGLRWRPINAVTVAARWRFVGSRDDYALPAGVQTLEAYATTSVEAAWTATAATTVRVVVDNLFSDSYEEALGFPAADARIRLLLTQRLR